MNSVLGGGSQKGSLNRFTGYSVKAQCTGEPAYLEPNSECMQKPIEGLSAVHFRCPLSKGGGVDCSSTRVHGSFINQQGA